MNVVSLLLVGKSAAGIDNLSVVDLSILNVLGGSHNGYVYLSATSNHVIPVNKVDVCEKSKVELTVLDGQRFASSKEYRAKMTVCIHRGVVTRLIYVSAVLSVNRAGMTVLMLLGEVRDHLSHNIEKVVLKVLKVEGVDIV